MQETRLRSEADIWLRYLKAGFPRNYLDITAVHRLAHIVSMHPGYAEVFASMFADCLRALTPTQNTETEAVLMLHAINTVVYNLRIWTKSGSSDAEFLGSLLNASAGIMSELTARSWTNWSLNLGLTLLEWQLNYKIGNYLTPPLTKLLSSSAKQLVSYRDLHYTLLEDIDSSMLQRLFQDRQAEQLCSSILRVWEHSFYNPEPLREPYTNVFCHYAGSEGWQLLIKFTEKYVKSLQPPGCNELFSSLEQPLAHLPFTFVKTHFSTFLESSAGATVRDILHMTQASDYTTVLQSQEYINAVSALVSILSYTLESLQSTAPFLGKFLCELASMIGACQPTYWKEISKLVVTKNLAPAICNPLVSGITVSAENAGINLLSKTARLIQHACLGKPVELKGFEWVNQHVQRWQSELERAFAATYSARRSEPRNIALPKTLLIYDLNCLSIAVKHADIPISKCPGGVTTSYLKVAAASQAVSMVINPFAPSSDEILEEITHDDELVRKPAFSFGSNSTPTPPSSDRSRFAPFGLMVPDIIDIEDSTPSMQSLPLVQGNPQVIGNEYAPIGIFSSKVEARPARTEIIWETQTQPKRVVIEREHNSNEVEVDRQETQRNPDASRLTPLDLAKAVQTLASTRVTRKLQTEITKSMRQATQTVEVQTSAVGLQTDPDRQRLKILSRFETSIEVLDQETSTELDIDAMHSAKQSLIQQLEALKEYQKNEQVRVQAIHDYWSAQFQDLKLENFELKAQVTELKEAINSVQLPPPASDLDETKFSYLELRKELQLSHYISDETILKKCDPRYYLQMESPWKRSDKRSATRTTDDSFMRQHASSTKSLNLSRL